MATVINNDLTRGLRGRVGKWIVFRTRGGKTFAGHAPRKPDPAKQSVAQRQTRSAFREAAAWAVRTLKDPEQREYYLAIAKAESLPNAYTAALRAYMRRDVPKTMSGSSGSSGSQYPSTSVILTAQANTKSFTISKQMPINFNVSAAEGSFERRRRTRRRRKSLKEGSRRSMAPTITNTKATNLTNTQPPDSGLGTAHHIDFRHPDSTSQYQIVHNLEANAYQPKRAYRGRILKNEDVNLSPTEVIERRQPKKHGTYDYKHEGNKPHARPPAELRSWNS